MKGRGSFKRDSFYNCVLKKHGIEAIDDIKAANKELEEELADASEQLEEFKASHEEIQQLYNNILHARVQQAEESQVSNALLDTLARDNEELRSYVAE